MAYQLKIHLAARKEHISAAEWYELEKPGLGGRYVRAVDDTIGQILENPTQFSFLKGNYRHAIVDGFPYDIVYEFFPRRKFIHITAIFHTSRNPKEKFRNEE